MPTPILQISMGKWVEGFESPHIYNIYVFQDKSFHPISFFLLSNSRIFFNYFTANSMKVLCFYYFHVRISEASTFEIIDSNGKLSSSGLLIIHNPHISRNSDSVSELLTFLVLSNQIIINMDPRYF